MALVNAKAFYKSMTIIVNLIVILASIVVELSDLSLPFLNKSDWFLIALATANVILRFKSNKPIASTDKTVHVE